MYSHCNNIIMTSQKRNKETITSTVSPYLKTQVEEIVATGEFSSISDFVSIAVMDLIKKLEARKEQCPPKT